MIINWTVLSIGIMAIITFIVALILYIIMKRRSMFTDHVIQLAIEEGTGNGKFKLLPMDRQYIIDRQGKKRAVDRLHPEEEQDTHIYFGRRDKGISIMWPPGQPRLVQVPAKIMIHVEGHNVPIDPVAIVQNRADEGILDSSKLVGQFADEKILGLLVKVGNYVAQLENLAARMLKPMQFWIAIGILGLGLIGIAYLVYQGQGENATIMSELEIIKEALGIIEEVPQEVVPPAP